MSSSHSANYWRDSHCSVADVKAKSLPLGGERPRTRLMLVQCGSYIEWYELQVDSAKARVLGPVFIFLQHSSCCTSPACSSSGNRDSQVNTLSLSISCQIHVSSSVSLYVLWCFALGRDTDLLQIKAILARLILLCIFHTENRRQFPLHFVQYVSHKTDGRVEFSFQKTSNSTFKSS
jgi:hypothetical protein